MRILVLEDNPKRIAWFRDQSAERIETTAAGALVALLRETWDALFLDIDLGGGLNTEDANGHSGRTVAEWLRSHPDRADVVIVHSTNERIAPLVVADLQDRHPRVLAIPFPELQAMGIAQVVKSA